MKTFLRVCLFALFVTTGTALRCELCEAVGQTCFGPLEYCPRDSRCGIFLTNDTLGGIKFETVKKSCVKSSYCNGNFSVVNMGKSGMIVKHLFCCLGDECNRNTPAFPPVDTKPNGKRCPSCHSAQADVCDNDITQCTGDQNHCFAVSGIIELGENIVMTAFVKGCANRFWCAEMNTHSIPFGGLSYISSTTCTPGSSTPGSSRINVQVSRVARIIPQQWGLFLQAITMFLLMFLFL